MATHFDTPDLDPREPLEQDENTDDAMFAVTSAAVMEIRKATDDLAAGAISVTEWYEVMADIIATHHLAAYMVGKDSDEVTDDEIDALAEATADQLGYLSEFRKALEGEPNNSALAGKYRNRAEMYGEAVGASWWRGRGGLFRWPAYPGERSQCMVYCRCRMRVEVIDAENGDADMYWTLGPAEQHCPQCPARAKDWNPFQIRGWEWVEQPTRAHYA